MTKVYLVYAQGCKPYGSLDVKSKKYVVEIFTSRRLANKCADYLNQNWRLGFERNADFKEENIKYHFVKTEYISHTNYSKLPF